MKKLILAAVAALSLGFGSAYAAQPVHSDVPSYAPYTWGSVGGGQ